MDNGASNTMGVRSPYTGARNHTCSRCPPSPEPLRRTLAPWEMTPVSVAVFAAGLASDRLAACERVARARRQANVAASGVAKTTTRRRNFHARSQGAQDGRSAPKLQRLAQRVHSGVQLVACAPKEHRDLVEATLQQKKTKESGGGEPLMHCTPSSNS